MDYSALLQLAVHAAVKAGEEILAIYRNDFDVEWKPDNTPVTAADKAASQRIIQILSAAGFPIISEEESIAPYETRKHWEYFWLVDPLDGTKEFIKRNGEFATNIALIKGTEPVIGVIYAPVWNCLYFAASGQGSFKAQAIAAPGDDIASWFNNINLGTEKLPLQKAPATYTVVASRSHLSRDIYQYIRQLENRYGAVDIINAGSSIKQCWVAEGRAHEYPRYGTTMEWDTAAGQCILEETGKKLLDLETGLPMRYNKFSMENHFFVARQ
jgi:3'(2'), 5'-bisphosphate nucleotidase